MEEQTKLIKLLDKPKKEFRDLLNIIYSIRNNQFRISDAVIQYGLELIRKYKKKLKEEYYIILEELFYAGIDCQLIEMAHEAWLKLKQKFPNSEKIGLMNSMILEANCEIEESPIILLENIQKNLIDIESRKRNCAIKKAQLSTSEYINLLNSYITSNPNDSEVWLELADIYLEHMNYNKALFCLEEVLVLQPKKTLYMLRIAEILYTLGGTHNLQNAKNYYCFILSRDPHCTRASWGLLQTCKKLQANKFDQGIQEIYDLTAQSIQAQYAKCKQSQVIANFPFKIQSQIQKSTENKEQQQEKIQSIKENKQDSSEKQKEQSKDLLSEKKDQQAESPDSTLNE